MNRVLAGLTQDELSELSGVPQSTLSGIESGKHAPMVYFAIRIAKVLGVTVEELFPLDGENEG